MKFCTHLLALLGVLLDDRTAVFVESLEAQGDGLGVVIDAAGALSTAQQPLDQHLVRHVEEEHEAARCHLALELLALSRVTRVPVQQETLRVLEVRQHGGLDKVQHHVL